jgi:hypothetical protein
MSNKQQTALEWYSDKLLDILGELVNNFTIEQTLANHYALKKAEEMEKEQIKNAHGDEQSKLQDDGTWRVQTAEEYYNETYGGK